MFPLNQSLPLCRHFATLRTGASSHEGVSTEQGAHFQNANWLVRRKGKVVRLEFCAESAEYWVSSNCNCRYRSSRFLLNCACGCTSCIDLVTIHGRSREGRYYTSPDWDYLDTCVTQQLPEHKKIPIFGNGDVYNYTDWYEHLQVAAENADREREAAVSQGVDPVTPPESTLAGCMLARGALIKPWVRTW